MQTRKLISAALAVLVLGCAGYAGWRLNRHALALLAPAYISHTADAHALLDPTAVQRLQALVAPKARGGPRLIALTFDDGPYPVTTPLLLDRLHDLGVPATFFLIGDDAVRYPELTKRIAQDGNEIGNHTWSHPDLRRLTAPQIAQQLSRAKTVLVALTGQQTAGQIMRPPHGRFTEASVKATQAAGYDVVLWTDAPGDWHAARPQRLAEHMLSSATAPEIVILHSGSLPTIQMLALVVPRFKAAGYRFVTVSRLLGQVGPQGINERAHIQLKTDFGRER